MSSPELTISCTHFKPAVDTIESSKKACNSNSSWQISVISLSLSFERKVFWERSCGRSDEDDFEERKVMKERKRGKEREKEAM